MIKIVLEYIRLNNQLTIMKNKMKAIESLYAEEELSDEQYMKALLDSKLETEAHLKDLEKLKLKTEAL